MKAADVQEGTTVVVTKGFQTYTQDNKQPTFKVGTVLQFLRMDSKSYPTGYVQKFMVWKNVKSGQEYKTPYFSFDRVKPYAEGDELPTVQADGFKITYKGEIFKKKKFSDMGKVKASLLNIFGYQGKLYSMGDHDRNPELGWTQAPEWLSGPEEIDLEGFKEVCVVGVNGRKQTPVDFNCYEYMRGMDIQLKAICEYGSVVKEMFTKIKDDPEFSYFLTYSPAEYAEYRKLSISNRANQWSNRADYQREQQLEDDIQAMKEQPIIAATLKQLGFKSKDFKKTTKYGKTAIAFKTEEQLFALVDALPAENIDFFSVTSAGVKDYNREVKRKISIHKVLA